MDELVHEMSVRLMELSCFNASNFLREDGGFNHMDGSLDVNKGYHTTVDGVAVRKIFVANLPLKVSTADLLNKFQNYGKVYDVRVVPSTNNRPNTFGFVTYYTPVEASRALKDKHIFFRGRKLYVSPADSWHQPEELPDGTIIWDRRLLQKQVENGEEEGEDEDEEEELEDPAEINNDEATCPVSKLNDDCLHLIFNHLPINERITVGRVCRRWRKVNETMWHGIRKLDFSSPPLSDTTLTNNLLQLYLSLCPNIISLNIANSNHTLNSEAIVSIAKSCKSLEELTVRNISIKRRSLALLAQYCQNLSAFYMNACASAHDHEMIALVKKCKNLKRIGLKFSSTLSIGSGSWLKHIRCPLESLALEMYEMNPEFLLQGISRVQSTLKELSFISCPALRSSDLDAIANMVPNLTILTLAGMFSLIRQNALLPITKLRHLMRLDLEQNTTVCDDFMKELVKNCPSLIHLNLSGTDHYQLTDKGLILVAKFSNLTHLRLACHSTLNDTILKTMSHKLKNLKHLDLMGCHSISDQGCIDIITNCAQLESLDVSGCMGITNSTIQAAMKLAENGSKKKLHIIVGGTRVDIDVLFIKPEIQPFLNIDMETTVISRYEDLYESDYEGSDDPFDDYDMFDDEFGYHSYYDSDEDDFDSELDPTIWF